MKSFFASRNPDENYLRGLTEMPRQLVFIMGCHRSGTSMLYHLMAYTGAYDYISAYDIIKYPGLLRNRLEGCEADVKAAVDVAIQIENNRGVDNLPVGANYPEEYRFLLPPLTPSWFLNVRKHVEKLSFAPHLTERTLSRFLEICRKKRFLDVGNRPLVLKNPNDFYFNFAATHRLFPQAKMIFIHRHPLHILTSYVAGFGSIVDTKNVYAELIDPRYQSLFRSPLRRKLFQKAFRGNELPRLVASVLVRSYRYYLENIRHVPADAYLTMRYEDLCLDAPGHLSRIGNWLETDTQPRIPDKFVAPRNLTAPERVYDAYALYAEDMRPYLERHGYSLFPAANAPKQKYPVDLPSAECIRDKSAAAPHRHAGR